MTRIVLLVLLCLYPLLTWAAIQFPTLTGRVVDNANMLSAVEEQQLTALLASHEQRTTNQVVVVTLPELQGYQIEEFGYQLGRHWGIGQKDKNNGVLLIVGKQERTVRIEVGYGLESRLTDAMASLIIQNEIVPNFRQGRFGNGINQGTASIVRLLEGKYQPPSKANHTKKKKQNDNAPTAFIVLLLILGIAILIAVIVRAVISNPYKNSDFGNYTGGNISGGGGSRSGGGGFHGGGGSFGGGGASGRW